MAHAPSDSMRRLFAVAVGGVFTLLAIAATGLGLVIRMSNAPASAPARSGDSLLYNFGFYLAALAAIAAVVSALVTTWLVFDWRAQRGERSNRP